MATVTNNLTRIHDAEGTLTAGNLPAGGAGATANTDIYLQGSQSLGRRQTNTSDTGGFALVDAADNDCSASGTHVGVWVWVTHFGILDDLRVALCTGTTPASNYKYWTVALSEVPKLGGWLRLWVENNVGGTTGAGTYTASQTRCFGAMISFTGAPGGNAQNLIIDAADYLSGGGAALTLTGTSGVFSDFSTADENSSNQYGIFRVIGGVYNCFGRVKLGSSSSLVFTDASFTVIFPQQALVSDTWMGIDVDLQHASTAVTWLSCVVQSAGAKKGDLVVTGTSGTFTAIGLVAGNLRIVTLNSKCTVTQSAFGNCGQITAAGATLTDTQVSGYEGTANTSALIWDVATDPSTPMTGMTYIKGTAATHAIEFGTSSPTTMTLTNVTFSGYNASNGQNDSAIHIKRTTGTVDITITGGTSPSYRTDGATVNIIAGAVTVAVNVKNVAGTNIQNALVLLRAANGTGPFPFDATVTISNSGTTATVTHTSHGLATNDKVQIKGASLAANNGVWSITVTGTNAYTYTMGSSPGSSPTGTIKATFVALYGLTDSNGDISTSRVYSAAQPVAGWARKSSSAPYYKEALLGGSVSNTLGYAANLQLVSDE